MQPFFDAVMKAESLIRRYFFHAIKVAACAVACWVIWLISVAGIWIPLIKLTLTFGFIFFSVFLLWAFCSVAKDEYGQYQIYKERKTARLSGDYAAWCDFFEGYIGIENNLREGSLVLSHAQIYRDRARKGWLLFYISWWFNDTVKQPYSIGEDGVCFYVRCMYSGKMLSDKQIFSSFEKRLERAYSEARRRSKGYASVCTVCGKECCFDVREWTEVELSNSDFFTLTCSGLHKRRRYMPIEEYISYIRKEEGDDKV